jgi:hypothetical protein
MDARSKRCVERLDSRILELTEWITKEDIHSFKVQLRRQIAALEEAIQIIREEFENEQL